MKLTWAALCADCQEVFDARQHRACPVCGFHVWASLSRWLNRTPKEAAARG
jgi:rRNA maturation endonuclease Nob1